eukprot:1144866-Pelagomonas_calceolata.AAC.3
MTVSQLHLCRLSPTPPKITKCSSPVLPVSYTTQDNNMLFTCAACLLHHPRKQNALHLCCLPFGPPHAHPQQPPATQQHLLDKDGVALDLLL